MFINRHAGEAIKAPSKMFGAVLVTGARQVGKKTLLRKITKNISYVTLGSKIQLTSVINQSITFFKDNPPPVFIDEIQYAPKLFPQIKLMID